MLKPQADSGSSVRYEAVDAESQGQRLDNFLLGMLKGVPRSHVYRLIRSGQVRVNSGRVRAGHRLKEGDRVRVPPVARGASSPAQIPTDRVQWLADRILYEDSRILVLDKPAGMAVHGGSGVSVGCIEALRSLKPSLRKADLVHRLDRGTSGCLLVAKRRSALRQLHTLLREGGMKKCYLALLKGQWQKGQIEVNLPLTIDRRGGEGYVRVDPAGKVARTRFRAVDQFASQATLMDVMIVTGRTHQIRVHAAHSGHPVAGDERYGDESFNVTMASLGLHRLFLHAHAVEFVWPDSDEVFAVSAPLPEELSVVSDALNHQPAGRRGQRPGLGGRAKAR